MTILALCVHAGSSSGSRRADHAEAPIPRKNGRPEDGPDARPAVLTAMISLSAASRPKTTVTANRSETGIVYGRVLGMTNGTRCEMSSGREADLAASAIMNSTKMR